MEKLKCLFLAAIFIASISGCVSSTQSAMESWMGSYESELVSQWGPPTRVFDTIDGKRMLTWESSWGNYGQNTCSKTFTIDEYGEIVHWRFKGCSY